MATRQFKHVSYLWDEAKAASLAGDEVALLIYRSNLLGADLRLTNYGGGNTSCKTIEKDPLTGKETEVMWVKGSGGDLGSLARNGLAGLYVDRLRSLRRSDTGTHFQFRRNPASLLNVAVLRLVHADPEHRGADLQFIAVA